MEKDLLKKICIDPDTSIRNSILVLNDTAKQILLVVDKDSRLLGTLTDGDIRRSMINNVSMNETVTNIMEKKPTTIFPDDMDKAESLMIKLKFHALPVIDQDRKVLDLVLWSDSKEIHEQLRTYELKKNKVFVLAGGKGSRLRPLTNILPKPLVPLGTVPIVEVIMKRFQHFGFNNFILSINYKGEMIKTYFNDNDEGFHIEYVQEDNYCGTAGSLSLIKKKIKDTIMVTNCDVIIDVNLDDYFSYHKKNNNDATIVGVIRHIKIPYGVMEVEKSELTTFKEKPDFDYIVNAGMYIIEPKVVHLIDDGKYLDMPDLLMNAKKSGMKVGVYPVASDMIDIGHWSDYELALAKAKKIGFISEVQ